jgi:predicted secreted hydrolase
MMRRCVATLLLVFAVLAFSRGGVVAASHDGFAPALPPYRFSFPRDHGSHVAYQSEWWYYTGHVRAKDGRRFGYELTFFRFGLRPGDPPRSREQSPWRGNQVYFAHFAVTDERAGTFVHFDRFAREALGMGRSAPGRVDVHVNDWWLRGDAPFRLHATADSTGATAAYALDLALRANKPPAVHGHGGVSRKGPCVSCSSHYYSLTRMQTAGTLTAGGTRFAVEGISWMDHEFGTDELLPNQAGWDWFSLQLDDGREFMFYRLRQKDGTLTPQSSGSLIDRNGHVTYLARGDVTTTATGTWASPHTGARYPSGWRMRVPRANLDVMLVPTLRDQELANAVGGVSYWEGAVDLRDTAGKTIGVGYVELTGYAGALSQF